ncbi:MAG: cyclase [Thermocrispum sp.]
MSIRHSAFRIITAGAFVLAGAVAIAVPATAAPVDVVYDCQADTPLGPEQTTITQPVEVTAPETVAPGGALQVVIDPAPTDIPSEVNGNQVKELNTLELKAPIPANSTYVSAELSGGSNIGDTPPEIAVADGVATVSIAGPLVGGSTVELPTVTVQLTAGESGTIETTLSGTSYEDPGLTFTAVVSSIIGDQNVPVSCFPNPSPIFSTTTIG